MWKCESVWGGVLQEENRLKHRHNGRAWERGGGERGAGTSELRHIRLFQRMKLRRRGYKAEAEVHAGDKLSPLSIP